MARRGNGAGHGPSNGAGHPGECPCARCQGFQPGNVHSLKHGRYSRRARWAAAVVVEPVEREERKPLSQPEPPKVAPELPLRAPSRETAAEPPLSPRAWLSKESRRKSGGMLTRDLAGEQF